FAILGFAPLAAICVGGFLYCLALPLVHDFAGRRFGERAAFVAVLVVGFFPSLVIWSSLNLKDALAILLIIIALWCINRFAEAGRIRWLVGAYATLFPMESLRHYLFVGLALLLPIAVLIAFGTRRATQLTAALIASVLILVTAQTADLSTGLLNTLEATRQAMAQGA